jgi:hypothetical protein
MTQINCDKFQFSGIFRQFGFAQHIAADYGRMLRLSDMINEQTGSLDGPFKKPVFCEVRGIDTLALVVQLGVWLSSLM